MGPYLFLIVCTGVWIAFGWTLTARPDALDRAWTDIRALPLVAKPVVWIALFPWLSGLAIWESRWGSPRVRRVLVGLVAVTFIVFWASVTFSTPGDS